MNPGLDLFACGGKVIDWERLQNQCVDLPNLEYQAKSDGLSLQHCGNGQGLRSLVKVQSKPGQNGHPFGARQRAISAPKSLQKAKKAS